MANRMREAERALAADRLRSATTQQALFGSVHSTYQRSQSVAANLEGLSTAIFHLNTSLILYRVTDE